jgi:transposase
MILLAFERLQNGQIAEQLGVERHCVGRWRKRWQDSVDALLAIELNEPRAVLRRTIIDDLRDAHRSGCPDKFLPEQVAQVILIGSQSPRNFDRPVDDWTGRELADEVKKQDIVTSISTSRVNALLRLVKLKPQHRKEWCFTTEQDRELFEAQVKEVCETYLKASERQRLESTHTVCVDEMTSLQANERRANTKLPKPDQIGKMECQYTRHGTLSLTGSWDVVAGQMIRITIDETRNAEDFALHISKTVVTDPDANWIFVMDNLNTHYGEAIVRAVADLLGIDQAELGDKKRRRGILGSTASRRQFLSDPSHRIRFVYIPKHSSWLNQIEIIFGVIAKRVMRHGSFTSKDDLREKLRSFIEYYNRTYAKPINWTYDGTPKKTEKAERPRTWREKTQNKKIEKLLALVA